MRFSSHFEKLKKTLEQVSEYVHMFQMEGDLPARDFFDLRACLLRLKTPGTFIEIQEMYDLRMSLYSTQAISAFFNEERQDKYPELSKVLFFAEFDHSLLKDINFIMDEKGKIRDNASEELLRIRRKLHKNRSQVRNKIQSQMQDARKQGWAREDAELSFRNGRVVIPVLASHKRQIKGFIHDESATGQTVYIEPAALFETNNEIKELELEENREIKRILFAFSENLRPSIDQLIEVYRFLGIIDFIRAKAKLAISLEAVKPVLRNKPVIAWRKAKHPLLYLSFKEKHKEVVPLDIVMQADSRIMIISGPNAGGKSVCLKTVALNQLMLQYGLLIPMKENSEAGIFERIFIDIGDEQSLENDLSTYSSHLMNIHHFEKHSNAKTLVFIDEFGTGTEPDLGAAIAEASLEVLHKKGVYGVITTHYANLKVFADDHSGVENGAMLFDTDKMEPRFILKAGKPGSSFAFEIARKTGLSDEILKKAEHITGRDRIDFDLRLQQLEQEKEKLLNKQEELDRMDKFLNEVIQKYEYQEKDLRTRKQDIINEAKSEAKEILKSSNRLIEKAIKDIREAGADKEKTKEIRQELDEKKDKLIETSDKIESPKAQKKAVKKKPITKPIDKKAPLKVGDFVKIIGQKTTGTIEEIKGQNVVLSFDSMKIATKLNKLEKSRKPQSQTQKTNYSKVMDGLQERASQFNPELDVRGQRAEEVHYTVTQWLDDALLLGHYELQILHGKGNGVLRQMIRELLSRYDEIERYHDAPVDMGGAGITIIKRKR
jgi:DNA mismatch repair protein MutS2